MIKPNQIIQGDIREVARGLPDQSVNCIVTSPAYFGLRDYGTAKWVGGDEQCEHIQEKRIHPILLESKSSLGIPSDGGKRRLTENNGGNVARDKQYKKTCPKCGAQRKDKQMGLEETLEEYVYELVGVFRELRRVLRDDGTVWLNLGDSYFGSWGNYGDAGGGQRDKQTERFDRRAYEDKTVWRPPTSFPHSNLKPKDLIGIPWRVALALQADGWWLRSDIIWHKMNPMPESVTDRPTKSHEYIFLLSKSPRYYYDADAIREPLTRVWDETNIGENNMSTTGIAEGKILGRKTMPHGGLANTMPSRSGRNKRTVWKIATQPYTEAHFAVFPPKLIEPCILAGCPARVCSECGEPWVREIEKSRVNTRPDNSSKYGSSEDDIRTQGSGDKSGLRRRTELTVRTRGFFPTCQCNALHRSGIVLDPFFGSGTVGQVAVVNGRDWLGVELNADYITLAEKRIAETQPALFPPDKPANSKVKTEAKQLELISND